MILPAYHILRNASDMVLRRLREEWIAQGHDLTGDTARTMYSREEVERGIARLKFYINDYAVRLNRRVPPSQVPFVPGTGFGSGAQRQYLQGLVDYAQQRIGAASYREAVAIAFAIASAHKREGIPTKASARFSKTGKRTKWIDDAVADIEPALVQYLEGAIFEQVQDIILKL